MNLQQTLVAQFHHPRGILGRLAGWIMANRASNLERNRWTVELLQLNPTDHVLELGPGPGVTLGLILESVREGRVVAVDHSTSMLSRCRNAHRQALQAGRLELIQASFTSLPPLQDTFDKILAVNSLQFDGMSIETLRSVTDHLRPGGVIAVTFQPRGSHPSEGKAQAFASRLTDLFAAVGLTGLRIEKLPMKPVSALCVLAQKVEQKVA